MLGTEPNADVKRNLTTSRKASKPWGCGHWGNYVLSSAVICVRPDPGECEFALKPPVASQAPRHSSASELGRNLSAGWQKCQHLLGQAARSEQVLWGFPWHMTLGSNGWHGNELPWSLCGFSPTHPNTSMNLSTELWSASSFPPVMSALWLLFYVTYKDWCQLLFYVLCFGHFKLRN